MVTLVRVSNKTFPLLAQHGVLGRCNLPSSSVYYHRPSPLDRIVPVVSRVSRCGVCNLLELIELILHVASRPSQCDVCRHLGRRSYKFCDAHRTGLLSPESEACHLDNLAAGIASTFQPRELFVIEELRSEGILQTVTEKEYRGTGKGYIMKKTSIVS